MNLQFAYEVSIDFLGVDQHLERIKEFIRCFLFVKHRFKRKPGDLHRLRAHEAKIRV
ncbi:hypothetical protein D3C83_213390 [compost metagenome]